MQTPRTGVSRTKPPQRWMRAGSILISFAAITLLATAFGARLYSGPLSSVLLTFVLIALCIAIGLHVRFLFLARHEHRETVNVLDATEREYKSVFDNTLDGILILDDQAVCLEANPAALALFDTSYAELVGQPIEKFSQVWEISRTHGFVFSIAGGSIEKRGFCGAMARRFL